MVQLSSYKGRLGEPLPHQTWTALKIQYSGHDPPFPSKRKEKNIFNKNPSKQQQTKD
jgi:hypothetical protein